MENKLYIMGNGLDQHHKMKTSYRDFRDNYARKKSALWGQLQNLYGEALYTDMWWSDFESMLGNVDSMHLTSINNGLVLASCRVNELLNKSLPVLFGQWINSVDINMPKDNTLELDTESKYFTFNYTMTLERVYGVSENNIWHIHNSLNDFTKKGINPIVGHDIEIRKLMENYSELSHKLGGYIVDLITKEIQACAKHVKERIEENEEKFHQYSNIKHFVVMGFSFNPIDLPYIRKIIQVNQNVKDTDWLIYWHSKNEQNTFKQVLSDLQIEDSQIKLKEW